MYNVYQRGSGTGKVFWNKVPYVVINISDLGPRRRHRRGNWQNEPHRTKVPYHTQSFEHCYEEDIVKTMDFAREQLLANLHRHLAIRWYREIWAGKRKHSKIQKEIERRQARINQWHDYRLKKATEELVFARLKGE
jgi:hypothetical protein